MAGQLTARSDFAETLAIYLGVKSALKSGHYGKHPAIRAAAERVARSLSGDRSVFGVQMRMVGMLEKGATLDDLARRIRSSRRTVYRYLSSLEQAGIGITLDDGVYRVDKSAARLLTV